MSQDPPTTDNHDIPLIPPIGEKNAEDYADEWGSILNDDAWSALDRKLIVRDLLNNRSDYTPYEDALFWATDGDEELYVGTGSGWELVSAGFDALTLNTATVATAPSSTTDVVRKTELDDLSETVSGKADDPHDNSAHSETYLVSADLATVGETGDHADLTGVLADQHHSQDHDHTSSDVSLIPNAGLLNDSVTVAGNAIALGGSNTIDHSDLSTISSDQHHAQDHDHTSTSVSTVPNAGLKNDTVTVAGNVISLGGSSTIAHSDLSTISSDQHHAEDHDHTSTSVSTVPNTGLTNDTVTVAGNAIALGESQNIGHGDLSAISEDQHHSKNHDHTSADVSTIPNTGLSNDTVTVAGNVISLGGSSTIDHADLNAVSSDQHHSEDHDHSTSNVSTIPNGGLTNSSITIAGVSIELGASKSFDHSDLSSFDADDHHVAHEHPGDQSATGTVDINNNDVTNVDTLSGTYASHSFTGTTYNIDLQDDTVDGRIRDSSDNTIAWFRNGGNVEIPNGQLSEQGDRVATRTWTDSNFNNYTDSQARTAVDGADLSIQGVADSTQSDVDTLTTNFNSHETDTTNPHSVTAAQAGAVDVTGDSMSGSLDVEGVFASGVSDKAGTFGSTGHTNNYIQLRNSQYGGKVGYADGTNGTVLQSGNAEKNISLQVDSDVFDSGVEVLFADGETYNVDTPNGQLSEQGDRVASRAWTNSNFNNYLDSDAQAAIDNTKRTLEQLNIGKFELRLSQNEADGFSVRATDNPATGDPIFNVESSGGATRLKVTQSGGTYAYDELYENENDRVASRDWANSNFNNYSDSDARSAVSGSNLSVSTLDTSGGIEVEGSNSHEYAGVRAGSGANNGHLMLDSNGGNLYLNWEDNGDVRIYNGQLSSALDASNYNINSVSTLDVNDISISRDGIQSTGDWLEIDGNGSGLLFNYKNQSDESRFYGPVDIRSGISMDSSDWDDYEIQKNGSDADGVINFKT